MVHEPIRGFIDKIEEMLKLEQERQTELYGFDFENERPLAVQAVSVVGKNKELPPITGIKQTTPYVWSSIQNSKTLTEQIKKQDCS